MCNLYHSTPRDRLPAVFSGIVQQVDGPDYAPVIAPLKLAPFIRTNGECIVGQWGMIPPKSKTRIPTTSQGKRMSTNNARIERIAKAWTFRFPWARGQRCLIPADSYDEPYYGTGSNIWWRFARADGMPWALAGLWSEWTDTESGEITSNFTMILVGAEVT